MPRAIYDQTGNIILIADAARKRTDETAMTVPVTVREQPARTTRTFATHAPLPSPFEHIKKHTARAIASTTAEGKSQWEATLGEAQRALHAAEKTLHTVPHRTRSMLDRFWKRANTPVRLPGHVKQGRTPPTKLRLFILDTIRFGGTFAGIFVVLFVGINYQSFLQIAKAELALGGDLKTEQALQHIVDGPSERSTISPTSDHATTRENDTDMLAYLPAVGPYEDRLILPKLGENVPIVRPSMDALMQEDWKKFEDDIQTALHDGVVHYPGSAKPGQAGNFFVTGHSSYYPWDDGRYKDVFARLKELSPGDTYSVYYGGDLHTYRVTGKKEVKPNDVSVLDQPTDRRLATLMTCTPVGTTLRRLIVQAEEVDPRTGNVLKVGQKSTDEHKTPTVRLESLPI